MQLSHFDWHFADLRLSRGCQKNNQKGLSLEPEYDVHQWKRIFYFMHANYATIYQQFQKTMLQAYWLTKEEIMDKMIMKVWNQEVLMKVVLVKYFRSSVFTPNPSLASDPRRSWE